MTARTLESATTSDSDVTAAPVIRAAAVSFVASFTAAVGWLAVRRLVGGTSTPGLFPILGTAVAVNGTFVAVRWSRLHDRRDLTAGDWFIHGLLTASSAVLGGVLSHRDSATLGLVVWWATFIGQEAWWWTSILYHRTRPLAAGEAAAEEPKELSESSEPSESCEPEDASSEPLLPDGVDQQVTRRRDAAGRESVEGVFRVQFTAGQRTAELHLAFCPPLETAPRIEPQPLAGPTVQITIGQTEPYGARLELRRAPPLDEPAEVLLYVVYKL